jgi:hypothetical protein
MPRRPPRCSERAAPRRRRSDDAARRHDPRCVRLRHGRVRIEAPSRRARRRARDPAHAVGEGRATAVERAKASTAGASSGARAGGGGSVHAAALASGRGDGGALARCAPLQERRGVHDASVQPELREVRLPVSERPRLHPQRDVLHGGRRDGGLSSQAAVAPRRRSRRALTCRVRVRPSRS